MYLFELIPCVLRHPLDTFRLIKADRKHFSYLPAITLFLLYVFVRITSIFLVHYPLSATDPKDANFVLEIVFALVPPLSIAITVFGLTSIMDGESMLRENITAVAFCLVPYILFQLPFGLLSRILSKSEATMYGWLTTIILIWIIFLFVANVKVMNGYTMAKTLIVIILSIFSVLLFWGTIFLLYVLLNQFILFITGVFQELEFVLFGT